MARASTWRLRLPWKVATTPSPAAREICLQGKTAVVTGSSTGIGKYSALELASRGARVVMACRNEEKAEKARRDLVTELQDRSGSGHLIVRRLDLSSLRSVRRFAEEVIREEPRLDILVNNAGVMMCPLQCTEDGFEMQFGTNHLGHFLLTMLLLPRMIRSAWARIVNVSSAAHKVGRIDFDDLNWQKRKYSPAAAYASSKLANVLFTRELARRLEGTNVNVYAVHPGLVRTELGRHLDAVTFRGFRFLYRKCFGWCAKTPLEGAETTTHCAVDVDAGRETGLYYENSRVVAAAAAAEDEEVARRLWDASWKMVGLGQFDPLAGEQ